MCLKDYEGPTDIMSYINRLAEKEFGIIAGMNEMINLGVHLAEDAVQQLTLILARLDMTNGY